MQVKGNSFQFAQLGIQRGTKQLNEAASTIARDSAEPKDINSALVLMIESRQQVEASVRVIERSNRALESLIDLNA